MKIYISLWRSFFIGLYLITSASIHAQDPIKDINQTNPPSQALAPLYFLASDELMGRATNRPEINIAARYISELFRSFGLKEAPGTKDYFQTFDQPFIGPITSGTLTLGNKTFQLGKDLLLARGTILPSMTAPLVFANYGSEEDVANLDVRGKIVFTNFGINDSTPLLGSSIYRDAKQKLLKQKGALMLIERLKIPNSKWEPMMQLMTRERAILERDSILPVFVIHDEENELPSLLQGVTEVTLQLNGIPTIRNVKAKNVMGWLEGTDKVLKNQFLVLSAHYDHLGLASTPKMEEGKLDSIYNGARDNALGVTSVINAARYLALHPPKRSVLFVAFTGEEIGFLGSKYFVAHPPIPLNQLVFNFNNDNSSYNDTTIIKLNGMGRTSVDEDIKRACSAYGLTAMPDPALEFRSFERSDNAILAAKGVPAPSFGLGIKKFDETITNRYHQLSDEVGDMNTNYLMKFIKSYILSARYIADNPIQPTWKEGDMYEAAWKNLYLSYQKKEPVSLKENR